jgi:hypothetical protein
MPLSFPFRALRSVAIVVAMSTGLAAQTIPDRFQKNHDIHVESGEKIGEATCLNCSIYIRGQLAGDATALHGNVVVEQGAHVAGDVTVLLGRANIENAAQVGGDVTAIGGTVHRDPEGRVNGDVTSLAGGGWVLLIFLLPLAVLGGIIALIVWLVQRNRRPAPVAA